MVRWWWFGPAQTHAMIDHDLTAMASAGLGGAELSVVYPMSVDALEPAPYRYLSAEFCDAVRYAADRSYELGLRFDVTVGGGWSYGGPHIDRSLAARHLRWQTIELAPTESRYPIPQAAPGEELVAAYLGPGALESMPADLEVLNGIHAGQELDLSQASDGSSPGTRVLALAWSTPTGQGVKRAPLGGEGYLLDHYSMRATLTHLDAVGTPLLDAAQASGPGRVTAIFCDSLEVHGADWTPDLPTQFHERRGYDLLPILPLLLRADRHPWTENETVRSLRVDLGRTLTELYEENFLAPLHAFARERDVLLRVQGYGKPPAAMASYHGVDLVEGESWGWDGVPPTRWASSAAHALGENVVSSETWTWVASPSLTATPLDLQAEAIEHLSLGITQFIGHGWPSSPEQVPDPGWLFYAAGALSDRNPWWPVMPELTTMLARLGTVARLGEPVRQVGVYVPDAVAYGTLRPGSGSHSADVDLWRATRDAVGPELMGALRSAGYDVDVLDDAALATAAQRHRVVVQAGPAKVSERANKRLRETATSGVVVVPHHGEISEVLAAIAVVVPPDVAPTLTGVLPVHRRLRDGDIFLLLNVSAHVARGPLRLGVERRRWEAWDPTTGAITAIQPGRPVEVPAHGSLVVVGHDAADHDGETPCPSPAAVVRGEGRLTEERQDLAAQWQRGDSPLTLHATVEIPPGATVLVVDCGEATPLPSTGPASRVAGPSYRAGLQPPVGIAVVIEIDGEQQAALWAPPYRREIPVSSGLREITLTAFGSAARTVAGSRVLGGRQDALTRRYGRRFEFQDLDRAPVDQVAGLVEPTLWVR